MHGYVPENATLNGSDVSITVINRVEQTHVVAAQRPDGPETLKENLL